MFGMANSSKTIAFLQVRVMMMTLAAQDYTDAKPLINYS
jgi:hypothetical protein